MSISHDLTITHTYGSNQLTGTVTIVADAAAELSVSVPPNTNNYQANLTLEMDNLKELYILTDQDAVVRFRTSGNAPVGNLSLKGNQPFVWYSNIGVSSPLTGNVGLVLANNTGNNACQLELRALQDPTP